LLRALALYTGPLLPSLPYEEWARDRAAALARLHRQVLLALAAEGETAPKNGLHALLAEDPADEPVGQACCGCWRTWPQSRGPAHLHPLATRSERSWA